ncbi:hypothetical protein D3C80_1976990 [compost metagenome]
MALCRIRSTAAIVSMEEKARATESARDAIGFMWVALIIVDLRQRLPSRRAGNNAGPGITSFLKWK